MSDVDIYELKTKAVLIIQKKFWYPVWGIRRLLYTTAQIRMLKEWRLWDIVE